ncbi:hypothetical protein G6F65_020766 [Rhizopus arrhizus]|nr:hypothetical protein G6F65_020766 [Rhizopus arrhizus]
MCFMTSALPPKAPTGMPPPITLASVVMSGFTPVRPCTPCGPTRKPVITSSKISSAPCCVQTSRRPSRKPAAGLIRFMLPATGSTMTAAMVEASCSATMRSSVSAKWAPQSGWPRV